VNGVFERIGLVAENSMHLRPTDFLSNNTAQIQSSRQANDAKRRSRLVGWAWKDAYACMKKDWRSIRLG
jgi:hypothetical protein